MNLRLQYHPRDGENLKAQTGKHSSHRAGVDSLLIQHYTFWFSVILLIHLQYHPPPTPTFTRQMPPHWTPTSCHVLRDWTPLSAPTVLVDYTVTDCTVWRKQTAPVSTRTKSSWYGTSLSLSLHLSLSLSLSLHIYFSSGLSITLSLRVLSFILQKTDIVTTDTCETCQCYSGELRCVPKSCPACASVSTCIT